MLCHVVAEIHYANRRRDMRQHENWMFVIRELVTYFELYTNKPFRPTICIYLCYELSAQPNNSCAFAKILCLTFGNSTSVADLSAISVRGVLCSLVYIDRRFSSSCSSSSSSSSITEASVSIILDYTAQHPRRRPGPISYTSP
jgi:hypothetical protein